MNLEELKSAWQVYDKKIQTAQVIHEKLIESMMKERSFTRISKIKQQYNVFFIILLIELVGLSAVLIGNPFDFKYKLQFVPYAFLFAGIIIAFFNLLNLYKNISGPLSNNSIGTFLKNILDSYERNKVFEKWFGMIFLSIGLMVPLSFLPQKIEKNGLITTLLETALMMGITLLFYFLAFRFGAFKNRNKEKFSKDLAELNELKAMALELKD